MTGRRRPSGLKYTSQRFATIQMPDGREAKVPQAKDAATYICEVTPTGDWPKQALIVLLYDAVWMTEGSIFESQEMRPGRGMGNLKPMRVIAAQARIQVHEGNYGQMQRWLLCEAIEADTEVENMRVDQLSEAN